ncbi:MAG: tetratricopeptide repeat protein, partial [Deltaproteobacteria bacterium]|nr:tetratricopeptide repeat protein [Deltaproteobacteria bacterium]
QKGDPGTARGLLEKALRYKPRNQRARNMLGLSLFKLGELEKAESLYRGLIEDHPADPTLRVNLGLVFLKSGAASDAVRCFETAIDLQPDHAKSQNYLGLALAQKGEHARAREWFLKCGNSAMVERMTQALAASPIRAVAQEAEKLVDGERPFKSALTDKTDETEPVRPEQAQAAPAAEPIPTPELDPAGNTSKWVATPPAMAMPPPAGEDRTGGRALGRLQLAKRPSGATPIEAQTPEVPGPDEAAAQVPAQAPSSNPPPAQEAELAKAAEPVRDTNPDQRPVSVPPVSAGEIPTLVAFTEQKRLLGAPGEGTFLMGKAEVIVQVKAELLTRLDGLVAAFGAAELKPELKRFRGKATDKPFGEGARRMLRVLGDGRYVISREGRKFTVLELNEEPAYFREEILFSFEESLVFENGRVPSKTGADLHLVHLRGKGRLMLVTAGEPRAVDVKKGEPLRIPMDQLVGWHGPLLQPRLIPIVEDAPEMGIALELSGEGRALVDSPE